MAKQRNTFKAKGDPSRLVLSEPMGARIDEEGLNALSVRRCTFRFAKQLKNSRTETDALLSTLTNSEIDLRATLDGEPLAMPSMPQLATLWHKLPKDGLLEWTLSTQNLPAVVDACLSEGDDDFFMRLLTHPDTQEAAHTVLSNGAAIASTTRRHMQKTFAYMLEHFPQLRSQPISKTGMFDERYDFSLAQECLAQGFVEGFCMLAELDALPDIYAKLHLNCEDENPDYAILAAVAYPQALDALFRHGYSLTPQQVEGVSLAPLTKKTCLPIGHSLFGKSDEVVREKLLSNFAEATERASIQAAETLAPFRDGQHPSCAQLRALSREDVCLVASQSQADFAELMHPKYWRAERAAHYALYKALPEHVQNMLPLPVQAPTSPNTAWGRG